VFGTKFQHRLVELNRAKTPQEKLAAFGGFSLGELAPVAPSTQEPRTGLSMGEHCELMARQWGITRAEQDELALASHLNAAKAYDQGFHDDLVVPFAGVLKDNNVRADTSLEKMATMKPAFDKSSGKGTLTAANSTPLTDGAAAVLLASEEWARANDLPVLAYLTMGQVAANDFAHGEGLLMAPTIAVSEMLKRAGLTLQDFDLYEIHEAFAAQVLCTLKAWEDADYCRKVLGRDEPMGAIDRSRLNPKGSSLAYGHPFAATGARILGLTAKELATEMKGRALISVCTAGGQGVAAIVERAA
jgi:acetyl-CoA C-acetyltransferase